MLSRALLSSSNENPPKTFHTLFVIHLRKMQAVAAVHAGLLKLLSAGYICLYERYC